MRKSCLLFGLIPALLLFSQQSFAAEKTESLDARLRLAESFVAKSDKYLHQSKLRRGMTGYGLTVMAGTKIEKFDVTIVSVMRNWYPHQDVILCRLSGLGLEKTGIIAGMSGSPVYIKDPADGKYKMIGALAYGWSFQNEPLCGVQPISQMLAIQDVPLPGDKPAAKADSASGTGDGRLNDDLAQAVLTPKKIDFSTLDLPKRTIRNTSGSNPQLVPLSTPIMAAGAGRQTIELAEKVFAGTGLVALRAGAVGAVEAEAAEKTKLAPGSSVSIPLITGDMDWTGVGTVTEVIGDRVLAFGHSMFAEGPVDIPMGTAYVHTVVSSAYASFKLGSTLKITGALTHDEYTGVSGQVGKKAEMIPVTVTCLWPTGEQKFEYNILRHRFFAPFLAAEVVFQSVYANRDIPERHTIAYAVNIEYAKFGRYSASNFSSDNDVYDVLSDLTRPLAGMTRTPLGEPVFPKSIDVTVTIQPVQKTASVLSVKLDRNVYKPGQEVTGLVTLKPFRAEEVTKSVSLALPDDLPDGQYTLTVCDASDLTSIRQREMPHRFTPKNLEQLFAAIKNVVEPRTDKLYVHLPLPSGGLAVKKNELENLPASMAELLSRETALDSVPYSRSKIVSFQADCVITGSTSAEFTVKKHPRREN